MAEETRNAKLLLGVETKGTDKAAKALDGIKQTATALDKELTAIGRSRQLDGLVKDFKAVASEGDAAEEAVAKLNKELTKLGASQDEIRGVARAISETRETGGGAGGGGGGSLPAAAKFRGAASFVGGGEIVGVIDDIQDAVEGIGQLGGSLSGVLAPGLTAGAVGMSAFLLPLAAISAVVIAVGLVIKAFVDQGNADAAQLQAQLDAQREIRQKLNEGATTADLTNDLNEMIEARDREAQALEDNTVKYNELTQNGMDSVKRLFDKTEDTLVGDIDKSITELDAWDEKIAETEDAIKNNAAAANDLAVAEEKLAAARTQSILDSAAAAGQEVAARSRADDASYESNLARVGAIDDETAAINAQLAVLQSSGDTSEAVTGKIAGLTAQLGALGGEADYINSTALAASKARDDAKKAAKDAEDAEKKSIADHERNVERAAAAQDKYTESIKNVNTQLKQAVEDIGTKRSQGETDIRISQGRDLDDIQLKNNKDLTKLISDDWRSARDDAFKNANEIDDIRREGLKSELEAIRDGDFKQLFLSREALKERLGEEKRTDDREDQMRKIHLSDAKDDLKTALRDETSIRRNASLRQMEDLKLGAQRELQQATTAKMRALEANNAYYAAELRQLGSFNNARLQMNAQAQQQLLQQGGNRARAGNTQSSTGISGQSTIDMSGVAGFVGRMIR